MKTEIELKLWLAKQLPEEIEIHAFAKPWFEWKSERRGIIGVKVTPREWDYIVRRVEGKLSYEQSSKYIAKLKNSLPSRSTDTVESEFTRWLIFAPWQTRATALMEILK